MNRENKISNLKLERYLLGELPIKEQRRIQKIISEDGEVRARLEHIERSNEEIRTSYPAERVVHEIEKKLGEKLSRIQWKAQRLGKVRAFVYAAVAVGVIAFALLPLRDLVVDRTDEELWVMRPKGLEPHLYVYRKSDSTVVRLENDAAVYETDVLQLSYVAGENRYGIIFSIDGRGTLTLHFPYHFAEGEPAPELEAQDEIALAYAYELDDAPRFERFFFVTSPKSFDITRVVDAGRTLASQQDKALKKPLPLPKGIQQCSITLRKETSAK